MKTTRLSVLNVALALILMASCDIEVVTVDEDVAAVKDYENHPEKKNLQNLIDQYTANGVAGINILIDDPKNGLWMGSSGFSSLEQDKKMMASNVHHTASIYKTYVATVIMQLVGENKIALNDKLTNYINTDIMDKIPNGKSVSIKNLLQHRSGIPDIFEMEFIADFFANPTKSYTIEALLEYVYNKEPLADVDTAFYYSDANYSLLTLVIEEIEGDFIQALKSRILIPLNLSETYFLENPNQTPLELVDTYWDSDDDGILENNSEIQIALTAGLRGADGIVTTANDLKSFIQALASGNLVKDMTSMLDFQEVSLEEQQNEIYSGYGMGLMKINISGEDWYGHLGSQIGSGAFVLYNVEKDLTVVALQNTGTFFAEDVKRKFFYQLLSDIEGIIL